MLFEVTGKRKLVGVGPGAIRLGISIWTLRSWCYKGRVASHKMGSKLMIEEAELDRLISESERPRIVGGRAS